MTKQIQWEIKKLQIAGIEIFNRKMTQGELASLEAEKIKFFKDEILAALAA